jgi:CDP-diacylglycerol--glycerol-3-phosphate 3-phosphatidyltransferase
MNTSFGPGAIVTPANGVSVARLLISPVFFAMVGDHSSWPALAVWVGLCLSDWIDGKLARRMGVTRSGAFLDPLADKVLVLGALFALVAHQRFWIVPVTIIAVREVLISLYRSVAGRKGITVPASRGGKLKTIAQQFAVGLLLLPPVADHSDVPARVTLWIAVALTVATGAHYLYTAGGRARSQRTGRVAER